MRAPRLRGAIMALVALVLVDPIRDGRVEPAKWQPALRMAGAVCFVVFLAALSHVLAAERLRTMGDLVGVGPGLYLPQLGMPLVAVGIFLAMTLLQTAALHLFWPLRLLALVVMLTTTGTGLVNAVFTPWLLLTMLAVLVALPIFHVVRAGRRFATHELVVVAALVFAATQLPMLGATAGSSLGFETRGMVLTSQLQAMWLLAVPGLVTAGTALTQVSVTAGEAVGSVVGARLRLGWLQVVVGALLLWRTWAVVSAYLQGLPPTIAPDLAGTLFALVMAVAISVPFVIRARRCEEPERATPGALASEFAGVSFLLVAASTLWLILPAAFYLVPVALIPLGATAPEWVWAIAGMGNHPLTGTLSRVVAGLGGLVVSWRLAGQGRWLAGILVGGFLGIQLVVLTATLVPDAPFSISGQAFDVWLHLALLAATAVVAARGADPRRLSALLGAVAILTLHDFRDILENPIAAVVGFSALGAVLFGIVWRILTDSDYTRGDSPAFPIDSRVLLYLANAVFLATVVAYSALTRDATGFFSLSVWEELGDAVFARPLWVAAVLVALWTAAFGRPDSAQSESTSSDVSSANDPSTRV